VITVFTVEWRACALAHYTPGFGATVVRTFRIPAERDAYSVAHDRLNHPGDVPRRRPQHRGTMIPPLNHLDPFPEDRPVDTQVVNNLVAIINRFVDVLNAHAAIVDQHQEDIGRLYRYSPDAQLARLQARQRQDRRS
jgi:hypothetical protein